MATLTVEAFRSPRLVWIDANSDIVSVQEILNLLRDWEDSADGITEPQIISAAGKEDLGGGVAVGLTATLLNAKVAFEPPVLATSRGSVTTLDSSGLTVIDSSATFVTDGIITGATVINETTGAFGTVTTVDSETKVTLRSTVDGSRQDWQVTDVYAVHNIIAKNIQGGNLVALDEASTVIPVVLPSGYTQVTRTAASSATSQEELDIQFSSFASNAVWLDSSSGYSGTIYPNGTSRRPVDNDADAQSIASSRGLFDIQIRSNETITAAHSSMKFYGRSPRTTTLTIDSSATLSACEFENLLLTGDLGSNGSAYFTHLAIKNTTGLFGHIEQCVLREGTNTALPGAILMLNKCAAVSAFNPGVDIPIIDCNGSARIAMRLFTGEVKLTNKTSGADCSLGLTGAVVELDSTITFGNWICHGVGTIINNTTGTATVDTTDLVNPTELSDQVWDRPTAGHVIAGTTGKALLDIDTDIDQSLSATELNIRGADSDTLKIISDEIDAVPTVAENVDGVWDEKLTGATHNVPASAGRRIRQLSATSLLNEGTAQGSGAGPNQIQLENTASTVDNEYDPAMIYITEGTGAGQTRLIYQYTGATRTATVDRNWKVLPDVTSLYIVGPHVGREHVNEGLAQAGALNTITLNPLASAYDGAYVNQLVFLRSGTGDDQVGLIKAYDGTTKVATVERSWGVIPDSTTAYVMLPTHVHANQELADIVWDEALASHTDVGTAGAALDDASLGGTPADIADAVWDEARASHTAVGSMGELLTHLRQISVGRWKIVNDQWIFYDTDETTPLFTFDLKDASGSASSTTVFERDPV